MDRKNFLKAGCISCLSVAGITTLFASCSPTKYITGTLGKDGLHLDPAEFIERSGTSRSFRAFIIVRNEALQYPICVYRFSETEYSALWMRCTHQGAELQASGDHLQCSAHGSEFDNKGTVRNGPANRNLRNFPVTIIDNKLFIDLRAV